MEDKHCHETLTALRVEESVDNKKEWRSINKVELKIL